jgi:hypothetical protein
VFVAWTTTMVSIDSRSPIASSTAA